MHTARRLSAGAPPSVPADEPVEHMVVEEHEHGEKSAKHSEHNHVGSMTVDGAARQVQVAAPRRRWWRGGCCCCSTSSGADLAAQEAPREATPSEPTPKEPTPKEPHHDPSASAWDQPQPEEQAVGPTISHTTTSATGAAEGTILEMSGDLLCVRTMHVAYLDLDGKPKHVASTGYRAKIHLPLGVQEIEVSFSVVGGGKVCKVDREKPEMPWLKDAQGRKVPETFMYPTCSQHVQYFIQGSVMNSRVCQVDERATTESLIQLVSRDFRCIRTLNVAYTDGDGERKQWSGNGFNVKCHVPSVAKDVEVTFAAVGGSNVVKVDRRDPQLPFVQDANGKWAIEKFSYVQCPQYAQFDVRGTSFHTYICGVREQLKGASTDRVVPEPSLRLVDPVALFHQSVEDVPSIGGCVELRAPHSEFLLPPEVVLFEPTPNEMFSRVDQQEKGFRRIFLNTPLSQPETEALQEFHAFLGKRSPGPPDDNAPFPRYMAGHALRILQACKFNCTKAVEMMKVCTKERVRRLPILEADVLSDLQKGFIYWHGRDKNCRPCMVIRLERLGELAKDKEAAVRVVVYALEYALRYAMVPGRVENWVVIIDLVNVTRVVSPLHIGSLVSTAAAIGTTLEKVYCSRMVWIKIVNMPGGNGVLGRAINSAIPAEKRDKVSFPQDVAGDLRVHFQPNQLERRYGGTAPDLAPADTYPFHFFPNPRGDAAALTRSHTRDLENEPEVQQEDYSLHESTDLSFHEGRLWDDSSQEARNRWAQHARSASLTPAAAAALSRLVGGEPVLPCRDVTTWMKITNPGAAEQQSSVWARAAEADGGSSPSTRAASSPGPRGEGSPGSTSAASPGSRSAASPAAARLSL